MRLSHAESILFRTGPNNITVLFEADGSFDPTVVLQGLHQMVEGAERFHRTIESNFGPQFSAVRPINWSEHVAILEAPDLSATAMMDVARRMALPKSRPLWRAVIANPKGDGWTGLVLHFDHAIADGTRISRHITRRTLVRNAAGTPVDSLPVVSLDGLNQQTDAMLTPSQPALLRLEFDELSNLAVGSSGHSDALLRLGKRILDTETAFADLSKRRRNRASVARIEALQSGRDTLGNHARMMEVDLSKSSDRSPALFKVERTPWIERMRMAVAGGVPAKVLRPVVQAEFSRPGIVLTVVPGARFLPPLFGLDLKAIHPAAPVLGRPPLAITAVRTGTGFDICVNAHGPDGEDIPGLSERVASNMLRAVQSSS